MCLITFRLLTSSGVYFTGGSLNPARSFGPDVILRTFNSYHWIYWIGPLLGAIVAVIFYRLIKLLEYETANPGADSDGHEVRYVEPPRPVVDTSTSEFDSSTPTRYMTAVDANALGRRVDGTDESEFLPPFHPISKSLAQQPVKRTSPAHPAANGNGRSSNPLRPLPVYQHGGDGHRSQTFIDRPSDRPRAQHRPATGSSRSRYSEHDSDGRYRRGPSLESGSSTINSSSTTSSH